MNWLIVEPVVDKTLRSLCVKSYPGHPKGCPNFGKKDTCPPRCPIITDTLDFSKPIWAVFNVFDFGAHVEALRQKHPAWSKRQLECCLYWQGAARKQLRVILREFNREHPGLITVVIPEAQGVNVTATMERVGITLQWPPQDKTYQVALCGVPR